MPKPASGMERFRPDTTMTVQMSRFPPPTILKGLYALTDRVHSGLDHLTAVRELLEGGVRLIQLRDKEADPAACYEEARALLGLCHGYGALLIVNDRLDVALAAGADGVHLGQEDLDAVSARRAAGDRLLIGISTHSLEQALCAERDGADYIGFGPMFQTKTKDAGEPQGIDALREVRRHIRIPIAAIGGITMDRAEAVLGAGADMLAVASALMTSGQIAEVASRWVDALNRHCNTDAPGKEFRKS